MFQMYTWEDGLLSREDFLFQLTKLASTWEPIITNKKIGYYNVPAGFDIETSSFYDGKKVSENKRGVMYVWQFGIYNLVTYGRTWEEYKSLISMVKKILGLQDNLRLIVYVHNLPYEFQFIRKRFEWEEVFILSERKPVYANNHGIEYRCSLKLAGGKSLENVAKDLMKYKVKKAVGSLDYNLIRTSKTPLTKEELYYCEYDIRVILCYIMEKIEQDGDITKIPLTNTGYVRNYCRKNCYKRWKKYRSIIEKLVLTPEEYSQLKRTFGGGFTHANAHWVMKLLEMVGSHDFTSSYPAVMVLEKFPMSSAKLLDREVNEEELSKYLHSYCCMFDLEIYNIIPKVNNEHPISKSKCFIAQNCIVDNGRVVAASRIKLSVTEQDFFTYQEFYEWDYIIVSNFRYYEKDYLPKQFVDSILTLYERKTVLKGVEGEELDYMILKNMLNAAYGMVVTDIVRDNLDYEDDVFSKTPANIEKEIEKYNKNIRRFLFYPWGVWVTAYARANLFSGILALGNDYVYSDTDSIKTLNTEKHSDYFEKYNSEIMRKIELSSQHFGFDISRFSPLNQKGEKITIGLWDDEGIYDEFKTLGAKRYMTKRGERYSLTVAGVNKKSAMEYLEQTGNPFENFTDNLVVPPDYSKRLNLTYIDSATKGVVIDYMGNLSEYEELSSVHMEATEYSLSMSDEFISYLQGYVDFGE